MALARFLLYAQLTAVLLPSGLGANPEDVCDHGDDDCEIPILPGQKGSHALLQRQIQPRLSVHAEEEAIPAIPLMVEVERTLLTKEQQEETQQTADAQQKATVQQKEEAQQKKVAQRQQTQPTAAREQAPAQAAPAPAPVSGNKALEFCDKDGLLSFRGANVSAGAQEDLQKAIMEDIENELSRNSVDQMAKDIFSFYICVRWVPDEVFWTVAKEELANDIIKTVVEHQKRPEEAISELYQTFKFVPLLCTKNLAVYEDKDPKTHTFFPSFEKKVISLANFLQNSPSKPVWKGLKGVDESFCNSDRMNSAKCDAEATFHDWANKVPDWLGGGFLKDYTVTTEDRWAAMHEVYNSFKVRSGSDHQSWNNDFNDWKANFPYHSFINKPGGASHSASPKSTERFMVCFGKRVASDLHRRPAGNNIITDQNSVGCHGMWDASKLPQMLTRMVALWKPPTCQLAMKTYEMKKQILRMYTKMNEDLYGALPSMLHDEKLFQDGTLQEALAGPQPYNVQAATVGNDAYYEGMRVAKINDVAYRKADCSWYKPTSWCEIRITQGTGGTVHIEEGKVKVLWDGDESGIRRDVGAGDLQVVPQEYGINQPGVLDHVANTLNKVGSWVTDLFKSTEASYTNLAELLSGSMAKWVVCGVAQNVSYTELDNWLGTEDEAFQEHIKEAYSKWTGYKKKLPGEECTEDPLVDTSKFKSCRACDYSELHEDHPEKYWRADGQQDNFMCPLEPPMAAPDQLDIFKQKKGKCFLYMTSEHQRQYQWHYHGDFPARKQNNVQDNSPREEYQLVKLLDISQSKGPQQVSFGRSCTVEERKANPRFCRTPETQEPWPSVEEMAASVSSWLGGAVGVPYGAITATISNYQSIISQNKNVSEKAKEVAVALGEQGWDALFGLGRLAHRTVRTAANQVAYSLPNEANRHARLEHELFGYSDGGAILHGLSYQATIGASDTTSNSRNRYRRYAVECDCDEFDPGLELALRWQWSETALRAILEAVRQEPLILDQQAPVVEIRSEARMFVKQNAEHTNNTFYAYGAAIRALVDGNAAPDDKTSQPVECHLERNWLSTKCVPSDKCELENWWSHKCKPKGSFADTGAGAHNAWKVILDGKLAEQVGGNPIGQAPFSSLKALTVHFHCGKKSDFGETGGPRTLPGTFRNCLEAGVKDNAIRKAAEPWRLYSPDEVVVVAEFGTLDTRECLADPSVKSTLCADGAVEVQMLDSHLDSQAKLPGPTGGMYRGMRTGSGFPKGTVKEVTLKPEDILTVNGMLVG